MARSVPVDDSIPDLTRNPYAIYKRLRAKEPVCKVPTVGRKLTTKAADTRHVKDTPSLFSNNDSNTPMERAFQAHTLMRRDGDAHLRDRGAMAPAFHPRQLRDHWTAIYRDVAEDYVARLPRRQVVDLFRKKKIHQSFGTGPHFCQGTHVVRMMLSQLMLPLLFDRFPNMQLKHAEDVVWHGFGFRGPLNLPARLN